MTAKNEFFSLLFRATIIHGQIDAFVCSSVASQPAGHGDSLRILQHWSRALSPQDDNVVIYLGHRYKDTEV